MSPKDICIEAKKFGAVLPLKERLLMRWRPMICPFHILLEHVPQDASILDVGCGAGLWLNILRAFGRIKKGKGFDVSENKVRMAELVCRGDDDIEFLAIKPDDKWPEGNYDCVTMIDVLHHVRPSEQREFLKRIEKTGAKRVIFKDIDPEAKFKSFMNTLHDLVLSRQKPRYCTKQEVSEWLEDMGFTVREVFRCDMLWYSHYAVIAEKE